MRSITLERKVSDYSLSVESHNSQKVKSLSNQSSFKVVVYSGSMILATLVALAALKSSEAYSNQTSDQQKTQNKSQEPLFNITDTQKQSFLADIAPVCFHPFTNLLIPYTDALGPECQICPTEGDLLAGQTLETARAQYEQMVDIQRAAQDMAKRWKHFFST